MDECRRLNIGVIYVPFIGCDRVLIYQQLQIMWFLGAGLEINNRIKYSYIIDIYLLDLIDQSQMLCHALEILAITMLINRMPQRTPK